ncbi:hypothetical protein [Zestomonas carbonaria]|uniref:Yip1 domain-containing protein n=1 Tax=Zestomonas carbonaria TaxID=2762745 RepID=A0A7U7ERQ5_9GAMM|nr:hypothetical protein [Pseudomonas carbonaria]CAD5109958.1 hypothetical protein PSEWESI4_04274 [Pseudomonas carbonaria]
MSALNDFLVTRVLPLSGAVYRDFTAYLRDADAFFDRQGRRNAPCLRSALFGLLMAAMLMLLGLPGMRQAGIDISNEFLIFGTVLNWMLLVVYGGAYWLGARVLNGRGGFLAVVNSFFFVSIFLVFLKLFEIPTRALKLRMMAESCGVGGDFGARVTQTIAADGSLLLTESLVLLGYLLFLYQAYRMQVRLHGFGRLRGFVSAVLGTLLLAFVVSKVQEPAIHALVCGYSKTG